MPLYLADDGHAYLDVVMGSETASAVWDTGAGVTVVNASFVAQHPQMFNKVEPTSGTDGTGQTQQTPTYIMDPVSIAGMSFEAQKVAAVDLSAANATLNRPMDLILGYPTLRQAIWYMDFPRRQWALLPLPRQQLTHLEEYDPTERPAQGFPNARCLVLVLGGWGHGEVHA